MNKNPRWLGCVNPTVTFTTETRPTRVDDLFFIARAEQRSMIGYPDTRYFYPGSP